MGLVGCEANYRPNRKVQGQKEWQYVYDHLTFIAKNHQGWLNLCRLISESHRSGFYGRACVDPELIDLYHEGLICMTGCLGGQLAKRIRGEDEGGALQWVRYLLNVFGDDLFFEMMPHDIDDQRLANVEGGRIADRFGIAKITTIDEHYPEAHWAPVQDALLMIATNQTVNKREKKRMEGEDVYEFSLKTFYHQTPTRSGPTTPPSTR
jgi:DNA polymerase-3 subunit alpha